MCEREEACKSIRECTDPKKIKRLGDKIETKPKWEEVKEKTMKCILMAKFLQNKDLRRKLSETGDVALMECTTNHFWGTGWRLDAYEWQKSMKFPGRNRLGKLLEEVREEIRMTPIPTNLSYTQMDQQAAASRQLPLESSVNMEVQEYTVQDGTDQPATDGNTASGLSGEQINAPSSNSAKADSTKPNKDANGTERASVGAVGGAIEQTDNDDGKASMSTSNTNLTEIDEADVTSLSCDSDLLRSSFSAKSVILEEGYLDCDRMMQWALPAVNISRLRQIAANDKCTSFGGRPTNAAGSAKNVKGNITLPTSLSREAHPAHSTPMSHVTRRKNRKSVKVDEQTQKLEEKYNLLKMLSNIQPTE